MQRREVREIPIGDGQRTLLKLVIARKPREPCSGQPVLFDDDLELLRAQDGRDRRHLAFEGIGGCGIDRDDGLAVAKAHLAHLQILGGLLKLRGDLAAGTFLKRLVKPRCCFGRDQVGQKRLVGAGDQDIGICVERVENAAMGLGREVRQADHRGVSRLELVADFHGPVVDLDGRADIVHDGAGLGPGQRRIDARGDGAQKPGQRAVVYRQQL